MATCTGTRWTVRTASVPCIAETPGAASCARAAAVLRKGGPEQAAGLCLRTTFFCSRVESRLCRPSGASCRRRGAMLVVRAAKMMGEDPDWTDDDYIVVGLGHCFVKDEAGKLKDKFVVEPIPAGAVECMENGGTTCYKLATATTLGVALKQNLSLLPSEFAGAQFCDDFDFRAKCASRTWKRDHPQAHLMNLVPKDGVRSDFNFSLLDKRVLNMENIVNDSDNIKQDMSIDVYGREKEEEMSKEIADLYSV